MSYSLWRTQRPRFPLYNPDGRGRDYYIKFDNGGYWSTQFNLKKKIDYERPVYSNFHTLFHQAAPFKYWGNGHGRETYILQTNGLFHDQKPLCAYKLTDFLRDGKSGTKYKNLRRKLYMSVSEKKYNDELRKFEKQLIKRLYTEPMNLKKSLTNKKYEINLEDSFKNINGSYDMKKSNSDFRGFKGNKGFAYYNTDISKDNKVIRGDNNYKEMKNSNNIIKEYNNKKGFENDKEFRKGFNTICNFHNKFGKKRHNLCIKTDAENSFKLSHMNDKTFNKYLDYNKFYQGINDHKNELKFTEPNHKMKVSFNFKQKPKNEKIKIKNIQIE
jgi:hypothetical protein